MICLDAPVEVALPHCGHAFCLKCSVNSETGETWTKCPLCSTPNYSRDQKQKGKPELFEIIDPMGKDDVIEDLNKQICGKIDLAFDFLLTLTKNQTKEEKSKLL